MAQKSNVWCWQLRLASFLAIGSAIAFSGDSTFAQITPDGTLPNNSIVTPSGNTSVIQGGTQVGTNLFHSFTQFSVPTGNTTHFNNADTIQNIFSRVTGGSASSIDGVIKANGTANVFLLNPNGIIFGPNARLDIRGSFLASTASRLNFADGTQFSAIAPQNTPLLTISVPIGLQFGGTAGGIRVQGSSLEVQPGKTLALVGGDVTLLQGGKLADSQEPYLASPGGRIELGSVAGIGEVSLNSRGNSWVLGYDSVNTFSNIQLENGAKVDASGPGGGDIQIHGDQLDLTQGSSIFANTQGLGVGKEVLIRTTRAVTLSEGSQIKADVLKGGTGTGVDVTIETGQLSIRGDGSLVSSSTLGKGQGGNLTVRAFDSVKLDGRDSGLFSQTEDAGNAGNLTITTRQLSVSNGAVISTSTNNKGNAGNLSVTTSDSVELDGRGSGLFSQTEDAGHAGSLTITTRRLSVSNGAVISPSTNNKGNGGNLSVTASDSVKLDGRGSGLFSQTEDAGNAGNLTIDTRRLSVFDGAQVSSGSTSTISGSGQGGNLSVTAFDSVELMGSSADGQSPSGLFTQTQGAKDAGNITITTRQLNVGKGAQVSATTSGQGKGGDIRVIADDSVNLFGVGSDKTGSGLFTRTTVQGQGGNIFVDTKAFRVADNAVVDARTTGEGNGGNITVKANTFEAVNGGQILASAFKDSTGSAGSIIVNTTDSATISGNAPFKRRVRIGQNRFVEDESATSGLFVRSRGSGDAGKLELTARSIRLDNQGEVSAETASGQGGDIKLQAQDLLLLRRNSKISTTAEGSGNGGNINIDTPFIIAAPLENSDITANAFNGQGGKITINATGIYGMVQRSRQDLERLHVKDLNPGNLPTNDITAFSQQNPTLSGIIQINTPDVDPSRGLLQLPTNLVDASKLIDTSCNSGSRQRKGSFNVTGRGGLPSSPYEMLTPLAVAVDWVTLNPSSDNRNSPSVTKKPTHPTPEPIVEATGWIRNAKGEVVLIANAPTTTPHSPQLTPACHTP